MSKPRLAVIVGLGVVPLLVGSVLYLFFGHDLVSSMYDGTSVGFLNTIIEQQAHVPVAHYHRKADALAMVGALFYLLLLAISAGYCLGRRRSLVQRVFNVAAYMVFLLIIGELSARVFFRIKGIDVAIYRNYSFRAIDNLLVPDAELGFRLSPSDRCYAVCSEFEVKYETNELGLRDEPVKPSDEYRILFLGDSVTFGWGVPYGERFTELVRDMIPGVQTINAGVPGYGLHQMYRWLEQHGMALNPDLVVCAVIFQDLNRAAIAEVPDIEPPHLSRNAPSHPSRPSSHETEKAVSTPELPPLDITSMLHSGLLTASDLYAFLRVKIAISVLNREMQERQLRIEQSRRAPGAVHNDVAWMARIREITEGILQEFASLLTHHRVSGMVVNLGPFPIDWLRALLEDLGIAYLDLSPLLAGNDGITFEIDPHYNSRGHALIAQGLVAEIASRYMRDIAG